MVDEAAVLAEDLSDCSDPSSDASDDEPQEKGESKGHDSGHDDMEVTAGNCVRSLAHVHTARALQEYFLVLFSTIPHGGLWIRQAMC